jgi:hypothetical protein
MDFHAVYLRDEEVAAGWINHLWPKRHNTPGVRRILRAHMGIMYWCRLCRLNKWRQRGTAIPLHRFPSAI